MFLLGSNRNFIPASKEKWLPLIASQVIKKQVGLTVVELMLALAILLLVLAGGYSFLFFGWSSFDRGTDRAVVQNNLRMAAEEITKEVRYAGSIEIIDASDVPGTVDDDYLYIFLNDNDKIEKKDINGSSIIPHELDSNILFDLSFESDGDILEIKITEINSGMEIETEVRILNLDNITGNSGNAIKVGFTIVQSANGDSSTAEWFKFNDYNENKRILGFVSNISDIIDGPGDNPVNLSIPQEIDGEQVVRIASGAFDPNEWTDWNTPLESVTLPEGLSEIGPNAFRNNNLTSIQLPSTLTSIAGDAFQNNSLGHLSIPSGVELWTNAFRDSGLTSIHLSEGIETIQADAFAGNTIEEVTVPSTVGTILNNSFRDLGIEKIHLADGIDINGGSFAGNPITEITIGNNVTISGVSNTLGNNQSNFSDVYGEHGAGTYIYDEGEGTWSLDGGDDPVYTIEHITHTGNSITFSVKEDGEAYDGTVADAFTLQEEGGNGLTDNDNVIADSVSWDGICSDGEATITYHDLVYTEASHNHGNVTADVTIETSNGASERIDLNVTLSWHAAGSAGEKNVNITGIQVQ